MIAIERARRSGVLAAFLTLGICGSVGAAPIHVVVNGREVPFTDQGPVSIQDHVLVPLRGVLEALGAQVTWNPATQAVGAMRGNTNVALVVGSRDASVNNTPVAMDVPAQLIGGRVMVPLRFVSEALGEEVHWTDATQTVTIQSSYGGVANGAPGGLNGAGVANGAPTPVNPPRTVAPGDNGVNVAAFRVISTGPYHADDVLQVEMRGTPGGRAFFSVGGSAKAIPMTETTRGVYRGDYKIPPRAHGENLTVVGRLEKGAASSPLVQAAEPVTIAALPPTISGQEPPLGTTVSNLRPTIYALFTAGSSPIDTAGVHLWVNGADVTGQATVTPAFVSYTPPTNLPEGAVAVKVEVQDTGGLTAARNWIFNIKAREGIKSLTTSATGALLAGDVLTVTLVGEPGGQAWFTLPGIDNRVAMTETNTPGQYVGTYTVRRGDQVIGDRLTAHLTVNGATFTEKATAPVTIVTKTAMKPVIESPAPNSRVGQEMTVTGRADPGSDVEITVTYQQTLLGILGTRGTIATERAKVDAAGQFRSPAIPLGGLFGTDGVHYTVQVVEIDAAGQRSEPAVVEVHG